MLLFIIIDWFIYIFFRRTSVNNIHWSFNLYLSSMEMLYTIYTVVYPFCIFPKLIVYIMTPLPERQNI